MSVAAPRILSIEAQLAPTAEDEIVHARFAMLGAGLLDSTRPDLVICPLMAGSFDVLDLVRRLAELGWKGTVRAVTDPLPDASAVRAEIRAEAAAITGSIAVEVIEIP